MCGDGTLDSTEEQCDDDNLANGDSCSSRCTIEQCGNGTLDTGEQCDDGNVLRSDGCNQACLIEFCGDRQIQVAAGEQCDDGNGISGDGCSSVCAMEGSPPADTSASKSAPLDAIRTPPPSSANNSPPLQPPIDTQTIIHEADSALKKTKAAQRLRTIDVLQQFIASPISAEVTREKKLTKEQLADVNTAIMGLRSAVAILPRDEFQAQVALGISKLKRQGINIEQDLPADYRTRFEKGKPAIDVLSTLLLLKEATEKEATDDLPASLESIRAEAESLRGALPVFEREYGLKAEEAEVFLKDIETVSREVTKQEAYRVATTMKRFLSHLKRRKIVGPADSFASSIALHAAAEAKRIAEKTGDPALLAQSGDPRSFVAVLTAIAPARYREAFAGGTMEQQRAALLEFLTGDERIRSLRATLQRDGQRDFDNRFDLIQHQILAVGTAASTSDPCSTSMSEALRCTAAYLQDLQEAVRSRSVFSRIVGTLQDFFGIGS